MYSLVLRIVQQSGPAEEVVQDVFLQLWRNSAQYDAARGPFVPWLLTLARNRALDTLRLKSERQRRLENQTEELYSVVVAPQYEKELDAKRRAECVRGLIAELNPQQKRAIELAYFQGLSHTEIAAAMNEPLSATALWKSPFADGIAINVVTLPPPPDWPKIVTLPESPPKPAMLSRTHSSDATRSSTPTFRCCRVIRSSYRRQASCTS